MKRFTVFCSLVAALTLASAAIAELAAPPVHYSKLFPFLPDTVEGFVAEEPGGSTASTADFKLTEVSRVYWKGELGVGGSATIKIVTGTRNQSFAAEYAKATRSPESGDRGFVLDGFPAIEHYDTTRDAGSLQVMVADRYLVEIEVNGLGTQALEEWWKRIDSAKLATFNPNEHGAPRVAQNEPGTPLRDR